MTEEKTTTKTAKVTEKKAAPKVAPKSEKFAVIKTGGKQYLVEEGRFYEFEKLEVEEGGDVVFEEVLLISDKGSVKIGEPFVTGSKVTGTMQKQFKDDKVVVLKYKPKKRYRKTTGHRQRKSEVMITKIA
jgi:large subunit ribosomal protein L21